MYHFSVLKTATQKVSPPFAVIGSLTRLTEFATYGIVRNHHYSDVSCSHWSLCVNTLIYVYLGRKYAWGTAYVENVDHCDVPYLREQIIQVRAD